MFPSRRTIAVLAASLAAAGGLAACGSDDEADAIREQATTMQEAREQADDIIEQAQDQAGVPDEVKEQLDAAQQQLDDALGAQ